MNDNLNLDWLSMTGQTHDVEEPPECRCIVRLTTSTWRDNDGIYLKKTLRYLRRDCLGYNLLEEDSSMIGSEEVFEKIQNLYECSDGIYQVVTCNEWSSWETPHIIEDYDYKLIPYERAKTWQ